MRPPHDQRDDPLDRRNSWDALERKRRSLTDILTIMVLAVIPLGAPAFLPWAIFSGMPPDTAVNGVRS